MDGEPLLAFLQGRCSDYEPPHGANDPSKDRPSRTHDLRFPGPGCTGAIAYPESRPLARAPACLGRVTGRDVGASAHSEAQRGSEADDLRQHAVDDPGPAPVRDAVESVLVDDKALIEVSVHS